MSLQSIRVDAYRQQNVDDNTLSWNVISPHTPITADLSALALPTGALLIIASGPGAHAVFTSSIDGLRSTSSTCGASYSVMTHEGREVVLASISPTDSYEVVEACIAALIAVIAPRAVFVLACEQAGAGRPGVYGVTSGLSLGGIAALPAPRLLVGAAAAALTSAVTKGVPAAVLCTFFDGVGLLELDVVQSLHAAILAVLQPTSLPSLQSGPGSPLPPWFGSVVDFEKKLKTSLRSDVLRFRGQLVPASMFS